MDFPSPAILRHLEKLCKCISPDALLEEFEQCAHAADINPHYISIREFEDIIDDMESELSTKEIMQLANCFGELELGVNFEKFCSAYSLIFNKNRKAEFSSVGKGKRSRRDRMQYSSDESSFQFSNMKMRLNKNLENRRLMKSSIRQKMKRGIKNDPTYGGFPGIVNALCDEDEASDGHLSVSDFANVLNSMINPLNTKEFKLLVSELQSKNNGGYLHYEKLGPFLSLENNFNSDNSSSDAVASEECRDSTPRLSLGSEFLTLERNVRAVLSKKSKEIGKTNFKNGEAAMLHIFKKLDRNKTGYLTIDGFKSAFQMIGMPLKNGEVKALIAMFPRNLNKETNYIEFLKRYRHTGQDNSLHYENQFLDKSKISRFKNALKKERYKLTKDGMLVDGTSAIPTFCSLLEIYLDFQNLLRDCYMHSGSINDEEFFKAFMHPNKKYIDYKKFLRHCETNHSRNLKSDDINKSTTNVSQNDENNILKLVHHFLKKPHPRYTNETNREALNKSFVIADQIKNGKSTSYLSKKDFDRVLKTVGLQFSSNNVNTFYALLTEYGIMKSNNINYLTFDRYFDEQNRNLLSKNNSLGKWLADCACTEERKNFERFMETIKEFKKAIKLDATSPKATPHDRTLISLGPKLTVSIEFIV